MKAPPPPPAPLPEAVHTVETPVALVDMDRVRHNLGVTMQYARAHGLDWRPHVKTHKAPALARLQVEAGAAGLTVATPREAEVMAPVASDLLLAHPPVPPKAERLGALPPGVRVSVALDGPDLLPYLARVAREAGRPLRILVEVDVGMGRVGVVRPEAALSLVQRLVGDAGLARHLPWGGLLFYPGHVRLHQDRQEEALAQVAARLGAFLEVLEGAGLPPGVVSGGSTPTLFGSHRIPGLTEIRPGTAIFHDRDSVALGVASLQEVAYTVLATVVSTGVPGQAVVDAGSKALAREEFRAVAGEGGYGLLLDRPEVHVAAVSEEHGILDLSASTWSPRVGDRVRIVPNHVCVSVNLQDHLLAFGREVEGFGTIRLPGRGRGRVTAAPPE
jgi:D-serine deaminase-like pyridoxal phosphate-dependent protein